jgi:tRNA modification GTPase
LIHEDTIFAIASGAGRAAIAVMRLSGALCRDALAALCGGQVPQTRRATLRRLRDADGAVLDRAMVLWLPGPGTYTGEDSVELFLHGGRAVTDGVAMALVALGLRPAEPGEFTRRAFLNGRMDLVEAEAVHDLISAETEAQRRQALRQLDGELGRVYREWSDRLRFMLAQQEALIDFPDEDLPPEVEAELAITVSSLRSEIAAHLNDARRGEKLREGLVFAITGPPNVGKSSLINALAERDVAIVSAIPGTTRDALETRVVLGGVPVTLVDTAGLREAVDEIEAEGVRRALARAEDADLVIEVTVSPGVMADEGPPFTTSFGKDVDGGPSPAMSQLAHLRRLKVFNKSDLGHPAPSDAIPISALTGAGLDALRDRLSAAARSLTETSGPPPLTRARHRAALLEALDRLNAAAATTLPELRGEDLRLALRAIGRITGHVGVEDILDTLFRQFCIGK